MKLGLSPIQAGDVEETIRECERAEAAGFDSVWLGEHHASGTLYPTPLIALAAIAARTRRIRLGTAVLLLPLYHPLAIAEEAAMVDAISGGRLILGVGAGYAPEEFAAFDVPLKERGSRRDEAVPLIQRLWSEDKVSHACRATRRCVARRSVSEARRGRDVRASLSRCVADTWRSCATCSWPGARSGRARSPATRSSARSKRRTSGGRTRS